MAGSDISRIMQSLGITLDLSDGDLVSDLILIAKIHKPDGGVTLISRTSEGTDWITRRGMIAAANEVDATGYRDADDTT
ncbi:hypothetical protein SAMN05421505_14918 [Sinosporangium album]|uniref:Uncharacterized protein n=1 Tax=Sinosporangium album TaxID=504805 RepID=A0A1G8KBE0_9ACTN|nr:hypothetical protein [Sinosporangium album]SDI40744.1 hypothetical protein SAMN05421505_14918 [Sinosporangium album]